MNKKIGYYVPITLLLGVVFGWLVGGAVGAGVGALAGVFLGWFIAAAAQENQNKQKKEQ